MTDFQEYLLKLLCEIDDICRRHGIHYALASGSLIGAVRHGGFLPWDDDADIYMTRDDFARFEEACATDLPPNRALELPVDPDYTNTFPRYTSLDTTAIHSHQSLNDHFVGVPIDIFIMEPMRRDQACIDGYAHDLMVYSDIVNYSAVFGRRFDVSADEYRAYRRMEEQEGTRRVRELFEEKLASHVDDDGELYVLRWGGNPLVFERTWFDTTVEVPFEGHSLMAGAGIDEFLTYHYGDEWYQVPLVSEHPAHDMASSLVMTPEEAREIALVEDREELKRLLDARKESMLASAPEGYALGKRVLEAEGAVMLKDVLSRFEEEGGALAGEFRPEDIPVYESVFGRHVAWQFAARTAGRDDWSGVRRMNHPVVAPLPDEARHALLRYLFNTEQVGKTARYLDMLEQTAGRLDDDEAALRKDVEALRQARAALQYGDPQGAADQVQALLTRHPYNKTALKVAIAALLKTGEADRAAELAARGREWYEADGDFPYFQACLAPDDAHALLSFAVRHTRNGLVLHDLPNHAACDEEIAELAQAALGGAELTAPVRVRTFDGEVARVYGDIQHEILRVCAEAGVKAIINPLQAQSALEGTGFAATDGDAYTVYLNGKDLRALTTYLQEHPDALPGSLGYDCMATNPFYPNFTLRFCDTRTVDLSSRISATYRYTGMFVSVQAFKPRRFRFLVRTARGLWRRGCWTWGRPWKAKRFLKARSWVGERLYAAVLGNCAKVREFDRVDLCRHSLVFEHAVFERLEQVRVGGVACYVPVDLQAYRRPLEEKQEEGLSFNHNRWFLTPRLAMGDQEREEYQALRQQQAQRSHDAVEDRRTRRRFARAFNAQKRLILEEDALRRGIDLEGGEDA